MNNSTRTFKDKQQFLAWLRSSGLKGEMESLITAAQDEALNSRYHHRNIMKQPTDSKCRMCYKGEHKHTVVGCTTLAPSEYTNRHSNVAGYIHWTVCEHGVTGYCLILRTYTWKGKKCQRYRNYVGCTGCHRSNSTIKPTWCGTAW
jgi:hypothetical protein